MIVTDAARHSAGAWRAASDAAFAAGDYDGGSELLFQAAPYDGTGTPGRGAPTGRIFTIARHLAYNVAKARASLPAMGRLSL